MITDVFSFREKKIIGVHVDKKVHSGANPTLSFRQSLQNFVRNRPLRVKKQAQPHDQAEGGKKSQTVRRGQKLPTEHVKRYGRSLLGLSVDFRALLQVPKGLQVAHREPCVFFHLLLFGAQ